MPPSSEPSSTPFAAPTATEIVHRPDPGLARGKWEAPPWFFYTAFAVVAVAALLYAAQRLGLLKRRGRAREAPPPSKRSNR